MDIRKFFTTKSKNLSSNELPQPPATVAQPPATVAQQPATVAQPPATVAQPPATVAQPPATIAQPPATVAQPPVTVAQPPATVTQPSATVAQPPATVTQPSATVAQPPADNIPEIPYQPSDTNIIPQQILQNKKKLNFQANWFKQFPWLHYEKNMEAVLCHTCAIASSKGLIDLAKKYDDAFISKGFKNWKKAIEKCNAHNRSATHKLANENVVFHQSQHDVNAQLIIQLKNDQHESRNVLLKLITSLRYLTRNGLAIRGKQNDDGNYISLLELRSDDDIMLKNWLKKTRNSFTSSKIQNEILQIMSNTVTKYICEQINISTYFGIIIDGTQDIQGKEQEAVCIRYVNSSLEICEDLIGLCEVSSTTGEALCNMLQDFLIRLELPIQNLRAQTYDGASNMSGMHKGCQARIKDIQPLAKYFHCGAHITHLVTSKAMMSADFIKDTIEQVQELGNIYGASGKFKHLYLNIDDNVSSLKPICPTRWLTRSPAIHAVKENYRSVLLALEEAATNFGITTAARANGIRKCML